MKIVFHFNDVGLVERHGITALPVNPHTLQTPLEYYNIATYSVRFIVCTWTCFILYLKWKCQALLGNKWASNMRDIL